MRRATWQKKRSSTRVTNFRKDWHEELCYRVAAFAARTKIWFSDNPVDIYGRPVAGCRVLHSNKRDLSKLWKVYYILYPRWLWWWKQCRRGKMKKALRHVIVYALFMGLVVVAGTVIYSVMKGR